MNGLMEHEKSKINAGRSVKRITRKPIKGELIGKIASSFYYTYENSTIDNVASELLEDEKIFSIAVVDDENRAKGIILRNKLFDLLSKPFGRDLHTRKPIITIASAVEQIFEKKSIFAIAENLSENLDPHTTVHYILTNERKQFSGIFSSRDILMYLSEITKKDIVLAKKLQSAIVRDEYEIITASTRITGCSKMAKGLGGDYYAVKKTGEHEWICMLADVSGKGVAASLLSVTLGGMASIYDFSRGLRDFIVSINDYIFNSFEPGTFVTGVFVSFNDLDGKAVIYDMGHSYSYVLRGNRVNQVKGSKTNIPLGISENIDPQCATITLEEGDVYLVVSDGIEEQTDVNDNEYGISRFLKILMNNLDEPVETLHKRVYSDIKLFRKGQAIGDDMTFVVLQKKTARE